MRRSHFFLSRFKWFSVLRNAKKDYLQTSGHGRSGAQAALASDQRAFRHRAEASLAGGSDFLTLLVPRVVLADDVVFAAARDVLACVAHFAEGSPDLHSPLELPRRAPTTLP